MDIVNSSYPFSNFLFLDNESHYKETEQERDISLSLQSTFTTSFSSITSSFISFSYFLPSSLPLFLSFSFFLHFVHFLSSIISSFISSIFFLPSSLPSFRPFSFFLHLFLHFVHFLSSFISSIYLLSLFCLQLVLLFLFLIPLNQSPSG